MRSRPRWSQSRSWLSSRTRCSVTRAVDAELSPDRVADASLECAQCFLFGFTFGEFAVVVDAAGGVVPDLGDGDHVDRMVQLGVAAGVESVTFPGPAGRLDRRGPVVGREAGRGREPGGVTDGAEDHPGDEGSTTSQP